MQLLSLVLFPSSPLGNDDPDAVDVLGRFGARTALSFAFAFLKRAWRSGEDHDLCSDVLQQALDVLQELPIPSLFNGPNISNVWLEVVDRSMEFLKSVCQGLEKRHSTMYMYLCMVSKWLHVQCMFLKGFLVFNCIL